MTLSHTRKRSALAIALQFFAAIVAGFVSNTQEVVADNLFVSLGNNIEELTPNGTSTTFASGVAAVGLAFNTNGDLFSTEDPGGSIFQFAQTGLNPPSPPPGFISHLAWHSIAAAISS